MSEQSFKAFLKVLARQRLVIAVVIAAWLAFPSARDADVQRAQEALRTRFELLSGGYARIVSPGVEVRSAVECSLKTSPLIVEVARTS